MSVLAATPKAIVYLSLGSANGGEMLCWQARAHELVQPAQAGFVATAVALSPGL